MSTLSISPAFAAPRASRPALSSRVRLTRRGRVVVFLAALAPRCSLRRSSSAPWPWVPRPPARPSRPRS